MQIYPFMIAMSPTDMDIQQALAHGDDRRCGRDGCWRYRLTRQAAKRLDRLAEYGTTVTVVFVGAKTCSSRWVKYETANLSAFCRFKLFPHGFYGDSSECNNEKSPD